MWGPYHCPKRRASAKILFDDGCKLALRGQGLTLAGVLLCALPAAQAQVAAPGAPGHFAAVKAPGSKLEKPSQPPAFRGLTLAGVLLCALPAAQAQVAAPGAPGQTFAAVDKAPGSKLEKPSQPPAFSIAVAPLGFSPPGPIYLGQQNSLASLDFLDENRLLFTFRVPGLIRREAEDTASSAERQIRAVVLTLPEGTVQAEALWTVHDRVRYLWMLKDGHFLFRDRDSLQLGDATLELKPFLRFPGPLLWIGMDPQQQLLATESVEPAAKKPAGQTAPEPRTQTDLVVRILRRDHGPGDAGQPRPRVRSSAHQLRRLPGKPARGRREVGS
jgi:hypothetical protein